MKAPRVFAVLFLAAFSCSSALVAQPSESQNAQLYMFWEIVVHPDKVALFEEAVKKQVTLYKTHDFAYPRWHGYPYYRYPYRYWW